MTDLVACLSTGKGSWNTVLELIESENWERIFLITNAFGKEHYKGKGDLIVLDMDLPLAELTSAMHTALREKKLGFEVATNFLSGSGKEHMALIAALMKLGGAIRLVYASGASMHELK